MGPQIVIDEDTVAALPGKSAAGRVSHRLLDELQIEPAALLDLISSASRLKMAVRGWVAETHLETYLKGIDGVTECVRIEEDGKPDIRLRWRGSRPITIECKNVLRTTYERAAQPGCSSQELWRSRRAGSGRRSYADGGAR